jgi:uncharacterized glyoxalase superfamily protein PhnB
MAFNRSAPPASVTPVLSYPDVAAAVDWLVHTFGFTEHVRIGEHRAQLGFGDGAIIVADTTSGRSAPSAGGGVTHSIMIRVADVAAHHERVQALGVTVLAAPADHPYGERQYSVEDLAGHRWTFTQTIADVEPEQWGGTTVTPW